jgi:hypothetical protein
MLTPVDQHEIEIDGDFTFARTNGFTQQAPIGRDDRSEASAGDRAHIAAGVRDNLSLLVSIQPGRGANDKAQFSKEPTINKKTVLAVLFRERLCTPKFH